MDPTISYFVSQPLEPGKESVSKQFRGLPTSNPLEPHCFLCQWIRQAQFKIAIEVLPSQLETLFQHSEVNLFQFWPENQHTHYNTSLSTFLTRPLPIQSLHLLEHGLAIHHFAFPNAVLLCLRVGTCHTFICWNCSIICDRYWSLRTTRGSKVMPWWSHNVPDQEIESCTKR